MGKASSGKGPEKTAPSKRSTSEIAAIPANGFLPSWTGSLYLHIILIMLLGLIIYSNTFNVPLLFDDLVFISENPLIKDFGYFNDSSKTEGLKLDENITRFFKTRRVGYFTLWANYRFRGLDVTGFHAANLTLHIINALLIYLIVMLTFRTPLLDGSRISENSRLIALFSGLLFVAHPLQTEAVTYIIKRIVLLASMFYLASTAAYIGSRLSTGRYSRCGLYALALLFAVLGMKTKENVFTLPVAIGLYEFMFFRGGIKRKALILAPFLLTMLIIPLTYIDMNMSENATFSAIIEGATKYPDSPPRMDYLYTQFNVIAKYLGLLFVPAGQNVDHDQSVFDSFFEPQVVLSLLFLISLFGLGLYLLYRSRTSDIALRLVAFGIFWFFLALSVESSILPIGEMMVEYRVYLPSAGAMLALGTGTFLLMDRLKEKAIRKVALSFLVIILLVLSTATYARNSVWKTDISLWEDVVKKSPEKFRGHNNLGIAYRSRGLLDKAIEHYITALRLKPDLAETHNNLGNIYRNKGLTDTAIEHYMTALRLKPDYAEAHNNLGNAYRSQGSFDKAIEHYKITLKLNPRYAFAYNNLGLAYGSLGLFDKAIDHLQTAIKLNPDLAAAHYNLGLAFLEKGLVRRARTEFEIALRLNPLYREAKQYLNQINQMYIR